MTKKGEKKGKTNIEKEAKTSKKILKLKKISKKKKIINFVSGNKNKLRELSDIFQKYIKDIEIKQLDIDLPELQGLPEEIVRGKLKLALEKAKKLEGPVLVEDTSLCFNAYGGLPGAYIKYFLKAIKPEGLYKMVCAFEDHSAYAQSIKIQKKKLIYLLVKLMEKLFLQEEIIILDGIHASNQKIIKKLMQRWQKKKKIK